MLAAWQRWRVKAAADRLSMKINDDVELRAHYTPELIGMSDVEGMAHTLEQANVWKAECSPEDLQEWGLFAGALHDQWVANGLTMPYWANLWALRTIQRRLGFKVPPVAEHSINELLP
jgi:hypothetical protein